MRSNIYALLVCCLLLSAASGCSQPDTGPLAPTKAQATAPPAAKAPAGANACELILAAEIEKMQGDKIIEAKPSSQRADNFIVSQCYYVAADNAKSVVLSVYRADPASPNARRPKEFWQERFASLSGERDKEAERERAGGKEEEEESTPPQPIAGLGDQAYWLDNKLGGALYVLKGDEFFRVSVGGISDASLRISKAKSIAQEALKRL